MYTEYSVDADFEEYDAIKLAIENGEADPSELEEWIAYHSNPANFPKAVTPPPVDSVAHFDPRWRANHSNMVFNTKYQEPEALCPALHLAAGRPLCWAGLPGCGKNHAAQALALAVITGRDAFERFPVTRKGRVLHITYDMGRWGTAIRYRRLANGMGLKPGEVENNLVLCAYPEINLVTDDAVDLFASALFGFDMCILDNARTAIPGIDENDSNFGGHIAAFGQACEQTKCVGTYLHHTTKKGKPGIEAVRGSSAISAASGAIFFIEADGAPDEPRTVTHVRSHDVLPNILPQFKLREAMGKPGTPHSFDVGGNPELHPIRLVAELEGDFGPKGTEGDSEFETMRKAILGAIARNPECGMRTLRAMVGGTSEIVTAVLDQLINAGLVLNVGSKHTYKLIIATNPL